MQLDELICAKLRAEFLYSKACVLSMLVAQ